jgi:Raf kinase inhibitor-like YbhB/YbcL family protein
MPYCLKVENMRFRLWPQKKWKQVLVVSFPTILVVAVLALAYTNFVNNIDPSFKSGDNLTSFTVTSPVFENGTAIPKLYTAQGENINPPLKVEGIPVGTKSLVLIVDDPSVPLMTWTHWVAWNIPPNAQITENLGQGVQGRNSWNNNGYSGPDPLFGAHSYFFKVYALDTALILNSDARKSDVLRAMDNHVLARAELFGVYIK